ncbi:MAG TPA: hypothetical protein VNL77_09060 [Roseiflexaceae bacterium]|nr:hypothetical protein [Roseiflexaceae bacterium]
MTVPQTQSVKERAADDADQSNGAECTPPEPAVTHRLATELPADLLDQAGELLDWLIGYAFDTLEASRLTLRVTPGAAPSHLPPAVL